MRPPSESLKNPPKLMPELSRRAVLLGAAVAPLLLTSAPASAVAAATAAAASFSVYPQLGHMGTVDAVAFSPDGRMIVSGSEADHMVKVWDVVSGRVLRTFEGSYGRGVAFSPDSRSIAAGDYDTLKLWDVTSGRELHAFTGFGGQVEAVAFSPDGRTIALALGPSNSTGAEGETAPAAEDRTVKLLDAASGRELRAFKGHKNDVRSVAFSPDGRSILSAGGDVRLWDVGSGRELHCFEGYSSAAFSPDGRSIVTGSCFCGKSGNTVKLWDIVSGQELHSFGGDMAVFSPDGRSIACYYFVTCPSEGEMKFLNIASGEVLRTFKLSWLTALLAFLPDGRSILIADNDGLRLWDVASGEVLRSFEGCGATLSSRAGFSPDGRSIVAGNPVPGNPVPFSDTFDFGRSSAVTVWDAATGRCLRTFKAPMRRGCDASEVVAVVFRPGGNIVAWTTDTIDGGNACTSGADIRTFRLWDVRSGRKLRTIRLRRQPLAFSPDGRSILLDVGNGSVLWDTATRRELRTFDTDVDEGVAVFSPDGRHIAAAERVGCC